VRKIIGAIVEANEKFNLIEEHDRIAVGVSGGKDSMLLLYALSLYQKFAPIKFEVIGITLKLGFPGMDFNPVVEFCKEKGIEYHQIPTQVYDILQLNPDKKGKIQCSLCSKFKKSILIDAAKKLNCNKVSMAHHFDDGVETLFMNAVFNGYLASFKPKMYLDKTDVTFIRPFVLCEEKEIIKACKRNQVPIVTSACPNDKKTSREEMKQWLHEDVYKRFPTAKNNFKNMLLNEDKVVLWDK
jgi:tRNA 2-thiocytidine biosynthesis protein TtcA